MQKGPGPGEASGGAPALDPTMFGPKNAYLFERPPLPEIPANYLPANAKIVVDIGEHVTIEDFAGVDALFDGADIVIPEVVGWTKDDRRTWQELARGSTGVFNAFLAAYGKPGVGADADPTGHDFRAKLIETIYERGRGKTIAFADAAAGQVPGLDRMDRSFVPGATSQDTLINYGLRTAKTAYISTYREVAMMRNLGPTVTSIIKAKPKLQAKESVLVLDLAGMEHLETLEDIAASPNVADGQIEFNIRLTEGGESVYQVPLIQAFRKLVMPTRQQVVSPLLWDALRTMPDLRLEPHEPIAPFPIHIRHAIMRQMAETPEAADIAHAIITGHRIQEFAVILTDHVNAALAEGQ